MQDYMIFFPSYDGEVREREDNLEIVKVVTKPIVQSTHSNTRIMPEPTKWHELQVMVYRDEKGNRYNVAYQSMPEADEIERAIMMHHPNPVPAR